MANKAYEILDQSLKLDCGYDLSIDQARLQSLLKSQRISIQSGPAELRAASFSGSSLIFSKAGKVEISLEMRRTNPLPFSLTLKNERGQAEQFQFPDGELRIPLSRLGPMRDKQLRAQFRQLQLQNMICKVRPVRALAFTKEDLSSTLHIVMHPHRFYDQHGVVSSEVNSLIAAKENRTVVLLENRGRRSTRELLLGAPYQPVDAELSLTPRTDTRFEVASNGIIDFLPLEKKVPGRFILSGGFFNACITHMLDSLFLSLQEGVEIRKIEIVLPMEAILVQADGEGELDTFRDMSSETTLWAFRELHPAEFATLLDRFLSYHFATWKEGMEAQKSLGKDSHPAALRLKLIDENQKLLRRLGADGPAVEITFRLQ